MRTLTFLAAAVGLTAAMACSNAVTNSGGSGGDAAGGSTSSSSSSSSSSGTGGSATACDDPQGAPGFAVGTGETCFQALTSGQEVPVMAGPQGGFHIWLSVGCADCAGPTVLSYGVKDPATGDWIAGTAENLTVAQLDPGGWHQGAGFQAFLPGIQWDPASQLPTGSHVLLYGAALDMDMNVLHEAEVEVVLGDQVSWAPPCDTGPTCGQPGSLPCCTLSDGAGGGAPDAGP